MENKYKIYCDMDGVIVDFTKGYFDLTGIDISGSHLEGKKFWQPINDAGRNFWVNLPWTKDGKELWSYIEKYKPELLSAPSRSNDSRVGKHDWVERELPNVHLILRTVKHKKDFAAPDAILIDDKPENIEDWINAGGKGILHTNTKDTIKKLKELGI